MYGTMAGRRQGQRSWEELLTMHRSPSAQRDHTQRNEKKKRLTENKAAFTAKKREKEARKQGVQTPASPQPQPQASQEGSGAVDSSQLS